MDHWFDQLRNDFEQLFWNPQDRYISNLTEWNRTPAVDVADHGDKYEMNIELPGINKEDINLEVRTEDVIAEMNDGILKVTLPKKKPTPKQKSKKVKIK